MNPGTSASPLHYQASWHGHNIVRQIGTNPKHPFNLDQRLVGHFTARLVSGWFRAEAFEPFVSRLSHL
jgi:hypothetical protein